jgi:hypothetical protein
MVLRMDALFLVDRHARQLGMTTAQRQDFPADACAKVAGGNPANLALLANLQRRLRRP